MGIYASINEKSIIFQSTKGEEDKYYVYGCRVPYKDFAYAMMTYYTDEYNRIKEINDRENASSEGKMKHWTREYERS